MNTTRAFLLITALGVAGTIGCGPIAIRALDPADGGAQSDVIGATDAVTRTDAVTPTDAVGGCASNDACDAGQYCAGAGCGTRGVCAARPQACTAEYAPVCGCDGRTYSNACGAAGAGARVAAQGECAATDGGVRTCASAADCGSLGECVFPESGCATRGVCQLPTPCFRAQAFCDCMGNTYESCQPTRSTRYVGPCEPSPDAGVDAGARRCAVNNDCGTREYCAGTGCGTAGVCAPRTDTCQENYAPVCGCDGATYGNACFAAGAGVRVAATGVCAGGQDAGPAGCTSSAGCRANETCVFADTGCARAGTCQSTIACLRAETFCGCDNVTFQGCVPDRPTRARGACEPAPDAGISRCAAVLCAAGMACCEATGACYNPACLACCMFAPPADAGAGVCAANSDCAAGQFCQALSCGARGSCAARPEVCTGIYAPVCGCDGRTYSSACVANAAGANVSYQGECR